MTDDRGENRSVSFINCNRTRRVGHHSPGVDLRVQRDWPTGNSNQFVRPDDGRRIPILGNRHSRCQCHVIHTAGINRDHFNVARGRRQVDAVLTTVRRGDNRRCR